MVDDTVHGADETNPNADPVVETDSPTATDQVDRPDPTNDSIADTGNDPEALPDGESTDGSTDGNPATTNTSVVNDPAAVNASNTRIGGLSTPDYVEENGIATALAPNGILEALRTAPLVLNTASSPGLPTRNDGATFLARKSPLDALDPAQAHQLVEGLHSPGAPVSATPGEDAAMDNLHLRLGELKSFLSGFHHPLDITTPVGGVVAFIKIHLLGEKPSWIQEQLDRLKSGEQTPATGPAPTAEANARAEAAAQADADEERNAPQKEADAARISGN